MRQILGIVYFYCVTPVFAGSVDQGSSSVLRPIWIPLLMVFAMLLVGITSRQISRSR